MEVSFPSCIFGSGTHPDDDLLNHKIRVIVKNGLRWSKAVLPHTEHLEIPVGGGGECGGEGITFAFDHLYLSHWPFSMTIQWNAQLSGTSFNIFWKTCRPTPHNIKHVHLSQKVTKEPFRSIPRPQSQPLFWFLTPYINSTNYESHINGFIQYLVFGNVCLLLFKTVFLRFIHTVLCNHSLFYF